MALLLAVVICLLAPTSALAETSYVFEPTLSLTGNCTTSGVDPVPDPGLCPIPPGVPGVDHPSKGFGSPSVTIDSYGDIYVTNIVEKEGRIDVFSASGNFIYELKIGSEPRSIAVDSKGNLYVFEFFSGSETRIRRFPPSVYEPLKEEIEYTLEPQVVVDKTKPVFALDTNTSLAVEPLSDQLYVDNGGAVGLFDSAAEETKFLKTAITGLTHSNSIALDAKHGKIYLSDKVSSKSVIRVFELKSPYGAIGTINGSTTPMGEFISPEGFLAVDVDEGAGEVFVGDIFSAQKVYQFKEDGTYLATIEHSFSNVPEGEIAVDNGPKSPHPQKAGWLFVPSNPSPSLGHVYAFEPKEECEPELESTSVTGITETEAVLRARINPCGLPTGYRLEYVSQQQFEEEGGESFLNGKGTIADEGTLPKGAEGVPVSAALEELSPDTGYRFRVFAENGEGTAESQRQFATFEEVGLPLPCANDVVRTGPSALLPDCRAYELVTPPDSNGLPPNGGLGSPIVRFPMLQASPDGNRASFAIEGGVIGSGGAGALNGDLYLATRGPEGWTSRNAGPSGEEETSPIPGSTSPDQTYALWLGIGSAVHIRYPDGHSELVGQGSLGEAPNVEAKLVTENADHIIFTGNKQLEENAPPAGTVAVYDRSAEGPTHVVSLLPGEEPQKAGENGKYLGASEEGEGIAFSIAGTIYVRLHGAETLEVAGPGTTFAGIAEEGKRVFYVEGGDLFAYDTAEEKAIPFSDSGDVTVVNVASGGSCAYLVSPSVLTGEPNPNGEEAEVGKENLYLSEEGTISFVGIVTERDVEGEGSSSGQVEGLGLWKDALESGQPAIDPSRTTPSGTTFLFESRADLTDFESEGFAQVYRYDSGENRLECLSCSPTDTPPSSSASLQSVPKTGEFLVPLDTFARVPNQSPDGRRAFFQAAEPLVIGDTDGKLDVYEWEEEGVGSCELEGGCIYLISSGHSPSGDYLYAMSGSGDDVFFRTSDLLLSRDAENTLSIYDARVEGGFLESKPEPPCEGEGCRPVSPVPVLPQDMTSAVGSDGNLPSQHEKKTCPKGKHKAKRHGKTVCVKNHKKKHRRAGTKRGGA